MKTEKASNEAMGLSEGLVTRSIDELVQERLQRAKASSPIVTNAGNTLQLAPMTGEQQILIKKVRTTISHFIEQAQESEQHARATETATQHDASENPDGSGGCELSIRDAGVSDAVWV